MRNWVMLSFGLLLLAACNNNETANTSAESEKVASVPEVSAPVPTPTPASTACELNLGWDPYEPYQYADLDGNVRGLDVDLVTAVSKAAGCTLRFTQDDWSNLLKGLQAGSIDLVAGASRTEDRETYALFSKPYRDESFVVFVRAGEASKWLADSLEEMIRDKKMRLGLIDGYVYGDTIDELLGHAEYGKNFISAPFSETHAANLLDGKIDGLLEDPYVASAMVRRKNLSERITQLEFSHRTGDVSLMFSKASISPERVATFDAAIDAIKASGEFEQIAQRYRK